MKTLLYIIWISLPLFFFLTALYGKLESTKGDRKRDDVRDFFYQGVFVSICVGISYFIDQYFLPDLVEKFAPEYLPLWFFEVILLPFVLLVVAQVVGPSEEIRILRAPRPTERRKKK